ncbi:predicted protein [Sclerotinia sclerotiorum 1980 UF-70]|uniref:Uncharacterized protein n=1 Tax=Sclerotinia sclerotiorum (strain ATCC 18683 / 1980 / Ss-1) TaxID=665079 RepID=A7EVJ8_SCLS1|nr:predicted protein [Sclerotinia sclerotiorum 1980 UF-70]XP_001589635.1 predicted protein [Sclerotinia sclerotiorum 1980 UF-70]EDN93490.1 predicted protein [Sclerotinia sclerotiorum 1980 UF-70]EDN97569.1 predicted protein [Sclerotinia sclerotiorum 1980 UF-70]
MHCTNATLLAALHLIPIEEARGGLVLQARVM